MNTSFRKPSSLLTAVLCVALAFASASCQGQVPTAVSAAQAAAEATVKGSGKIVGVINESGVDFTVQQAGEKIVGGADVYLDDLPSIRGKTGPDGKFELSGVPVGEHYVVAEKMTDKGPLKVRARATLSSPEQVADIKSLVVRQTGSVTGLVKLEGKTEGLLGTDVFVAGSTLISKAKDNGAFALINVAEGTYKVTASRGGYEPLTLEVEIKAGRSANLEFDLKKADPAAKVATLSGLVVGRGDRPLAGANVALRGPGNFSTITDENGNFFLSNVPDGDYVLHAYSAGHKIKALPQVVAVNPADEKTKNVQVGKLALESEGAEADSRPANNNQGGAQPGTGTPATGNPNGNPASPTTGGETPAGPTAPVTPNQTAEGAAGLNIPGVMDSENAFPGGTPRTTNFGQTLVGTAKYSVQLGQGFSPSKSGNLTGIALSLNTGDKATGFDTKVFIHKADATGMPEGSPIGSALITADKIKRFGLGSLWTPVVFASPIPVTGGAKYIAVLACDQGEVALLLSNKQSNAGELRISFAEIGSENWLWDKIPDNEGYNFAVFRTYMDK